MRKKVVVSFFILFVILSLSLIFAAENESVAEKGYDCLESEVEDKCSSLSTEEKIFSLMAIKLCKDEVLDDSSDDNCWPKSGCRLKTTAQAMLALKESKVNVNDSAEWLLSNTAAPPALDWLLQIDSPNSTSCTISYSGDSYEISIGEDKKIDRAAGTCLRLYGERYWLEVSDNCQDIEFEVSCRNAFSTNLLYKDQSSSIIYVSKKTSSASSEGRTTEKVSSFCFKQGASCDYEGSLWAALALDVSGYDSSPYIPYLVTMADSNQQYLPEAFLYALIGKSYRNDLLLKQRENKWWLASGDKFYDTALALYPFQNEQITEKTGSIAWLKEVQEDDGCWQGSIRNTAFILYSIFPKKSPSQPDSEPDVMDCEDEGYFCLSRANCEDAEGEVLDYSGCVGVNICCSKEEPLETCSEQAGEICDRDEECIDGTTVSASDLSSGEICCIGGECMEEQPAEEIECEVHNGECRGDCLSNEQAESYDCPSGICCIEKPAEKESYFGIIIFGVLILLVILGIVFRRKLRELMFRMKHRGKGPGPAQVQGPGYRPFPPSSPSRPLVRSPQTRTVPRTIMPSQSMPPARKPVSKSKEEIEDVLKKLKEIGK
jgi:hypothetical protein